MDRIRYEESDSTELVEPGWAFEVGFHLCFELGDDRSMIKLVILGPSCAIPSLMAKKL